MPKRTSDYHSWLLSQLIYPREAVHYLNAAIEDSPEMFLKALRNVAEAHKMAKVAEEAGVRRESLYRTLSEEGNPRLDTLTSILTVLGFRIALEPIHREQAIGGGTPSALEEQGQTRQEPDLNLGESRRGIEQLLIYQYQRQKDPNPQQYERY